MAFLRQFPVIILAGCVLSLLAACSSRSDISVDKNTDGTPSSWTTEIRSLDVDEQWWSRFNDEQLTQLVNEAQLKNTGVKQATARLNQAHAQAQIAGAKRLPQLSGTFDASRQKQSLANPNNPAAGATTEAYGAALNISWEIDLWGRLANQSEAAREDYLAATETLRSVRQSLAAQTAKSYFAVIEARQQVAFAQETVVSLTETSRQITNRVEQGIVPPVDKELAITNLENARGGLQRRNDAEQSLTRQLEEILRDYPSGAIVTSSELPEVPEPPPAGLPAELLQRRPDIIAAERALFAAELRTTAAQKSFLPAITLTGSAGSQSSDLDKLFNGDFSVWSIAGQLVQPLFQGGQLSATVELQRAQQDEAAEAYIEIVLQAFREVEDALAAERHLADREEALYKATEAAKNAQRIAVNRYEEGLTPFITVLESQQRALDTRSALISARRERLDNRVDLHLALGGGFNSSQETTE